MRYLTGVVILIAAGMACSRGPDRQVAGLPTSPSAAVSGDRAITFVGGVSGPMDVKFPVRSDPFQMRNDMESKYQNGLNRAATTTYVDREGEVVWTQEYIRYRVNGCDHAIGVSRVMTQIDGGVAGGICAEPPAGLVIFPSRADVLLFRIALETKYQQMGRGLSTTFVDAEGAVIWIQEYLRYRVNGCDHATAQQKVFAQIDGGPVSATCFVPCTYVLNPGNVDLSSAASTQTFEIRPVPTACDFTVASDASWLTFPSEFRVGSGFTPVVPFSVTQNNGSGRTGRITVTWSTGSVRLTVFQAGTPFAASFTMFDPFRVGGGAATECWFRSSSTPCNFTSSANLPGGSYTYAWTASYFYGTQKTVTGTAASFSFADACGGTGSTTAGDPSDLNITLTVTDDRGNSITLRSGEGNQPSLVVRRFTC